MEALPQQAIVRIVHTVVGVLEPVPREIFGYRNHHQANMRTAIVALCWPECCSVKEILGCELVIAAFMLRKAVMSHGVAPFVYSWSSWFVGSNDRVPST